MRKTIPLLTLILALAACSTSRRLPEYESPPVLQAMEMRPQQYQNQEGSLFTASSPGWSPWRDDKAHAQGDVLTVRVALTREAEERAGTALSRNSELNAGIEALFGLEEDLPGTDSDNPLNGTSPASLVKSSSTSDFEGDGETSRNGSITANVSAVVTHVYPNGNLLIQGSQMTRVNNERSLLTVEGIVRPSDISFSNVVDSDRIANARIEVTGRGVVSDKQRPGFLMRVFDWAWPI